MDTKQARWLFNSALHNETVAEGIDPNYTVFGTLVAVLGASYIQGDNNKVAAKKAADALRQWADLIDGEK